VNKFQEMHYVPLFFPEWAVTHVSFPGRFRCCFSDVDWCQLISPRNDDFTIDALSRTSALADGQRMNVVGSA
jgi:hypothetical protein